MSLVPQITSTQTNSKNLGGPFQGYSPQQTITNFKSSENVMARRVLVKSWNTQNAVGVINGRRRIITPFRAVTNLGDFLSRENYICGGPNQVNRTFPGRQGRMGNILSACDGTGIAAKSGNVRFVPDSSDYTTYRKQRAMNVNFNDLKNGGDQSHASYVPRMAIHR